MLLATADCLYLLTPPLPPSLLPVLRGINSDYTPLYGLFFSVPAAVVVGYIIRLIVAECQPADKKGPLQRTAL